MHTCDFPKEKVFLVFGIYRMWGVWLAGWLVCIKLSQAKPSKAEQLLDMGIF